MAKVLIVYYSRSGNTKRMAEHVANGARETGVQVDLKSVEEIDLDELQQAVAPLLYRLECAADIIDILIENMRPFPFTWDHHLLDAGGE